MAINDNDFQRLKEELEIAKKRSQERERLLEEKRELQKEDREAALLKEAEIDKKYPPDEEMYYAALALRIIQTAHNPEAARKVFAEAKDELVHHIVHNKAEYASLDSGREDLKQHARSQALFGFFSALEGEFDKKQKLHLPCVPSQLLGQALNTIENKGITPQVALEVERDHYDFLKRWNPTLLLRVPGHGDPVVAGPQPAVSTSTPVDLAWVKQKLTDYIKNPNQYTEEQACELLFLTILAVEDEDHGMDAEEEGVEICKEHTADYLRIFKDENGNFSYNAAKDFIFGVLGNYGFMPLKTWINDANLEDAQQVVYQTLNCYLNQEKAFPRLLNAKNAKDDSAVFKKANERLRSYSPVTLCANQNFTTGYGYGQTTTTGYGVYVPENYTYEPNAATGYGCNQPPQTYGQNAISRSVYYDQCDQGAFVVDANTWETLTHGSSRAISVDEILNLVFDSQINDLAFLKPAPLTPEELRAVGMLGWRIV